MNLKWFGCVKMFGISCHCVIMILLLTFRQSNTHHFLKIVKPSVDNKLMWNSSPQSFKPILMCGLINIVFLEEIFSFLNCKIGFSIYLFITTTLFDDETCDKKWCELYCKLPHSVKAASLEPFHKWTLAIQNVWAGFALSGLCTLILRIKIIQILRLYIHFISICLSFTDTPTQLKYVGQQCVWSCVW